MEVLLSFSKQLHTGRLLQLLIPLSSLSELSDKLSLNAYFYCDKSCVVQNFILIS